MENPLALEWADEELKSDIDVVLKAYNDDKYSIQQANRDCVIKMLFKHPDALQ